MTDREIDALIAQKFFGLIVEEEEVIYEDDSRAGLPHYLLDPRSNALVKAELVYRKLWWNCYCQGNEFTFTIYAPRPRGYARIVTLQASTEERAVCMATLAMLGVELKDG